MVYASLRTDPGDKGPDEREIKPHDLAFYVGVSREGQDYSYESLTLGGEGLELEDTTRALAFGTMEGLSCLAGNSRERRHRILMAYVRWILTASAELMGRKIFDMAMSVLEEEESDG